MIDHSFLSSPTFLWNRSNTGLVMIFIMTYTSSWCVGYSSRLPWVGRCETARFYRLRRDGIPLICMYFSFEMTSSSEFSDVNISVRDKYANIGLRLGRATCILWSDTLRTDHANILHMVRRYEHNVSPEASVVLRYGARQPYSCSATRHSHSGDDCRAWDDNWRRLSSNDSRPMNTRRNERDE